MLENKTWINEAIQKIKADFNRSADTHLIKLDFPYYSGVHLYLKDESVHPTGSLKHRLARSLFLYGICNGWIKKNTTIVESSSGSTAISEAYFAKLLNLKFIAVIPKTTSKEKIKQIEFYGGKCHLVSPGDIYTEAIKMGKKPNSHYMDQFTYAERATDWRGNNNIAEMIFKQFSFEPKKEPDWIVVSAGTGGTSATIGRYIRYNEHKTKLCVADPSNSAFYDFYTKKTIKNHYETSNIEGIGRPRVEPSFIPSLIDKMLKIKDEAAFATIHFLETIMNKKYGGSTGTNVYASFKIIEESIKKNEEISIVTLICDSGEKYLNTYYNLEWLKNNNFYINHHLKNLENFYQSKTYSLDY